MINRIHYNPPGPDISSRLNEEYVVLENREEHDVPLAGWVLTDSTPTGKRRHVYSFPRKFLLSPGHKIYLHTGRGRDSFRDATKNEPGRWDLYWRKRSFVWNNKGDTATLLDGESRVVDSLEVVPLKG